MFNEQLTDGISEREKKAVMRDQREEAQRFIAESPFLYHKIDMKIRQVGRYKQPVKVLVESVDIRELDGAGEIIQVKRLSEYKPHTEADLESVYKVSEDYENKTDMDRETLFLANAI